MAQAALKPCRFCGEAQALTVFAQYAERQRPAADGSFSDDPNLIEYVDFVSCDFCLALAPADVWDGTWKAQAGEREAYRAYWLATESAEVAA
jgi:hypothetical protein